MTRTLLTNFDPYQNTGTNLCLNPNCTSTGNYTADPSMPILVSSAGFDGATGYLKVVGSSNDYDRIRFIPTWSNLYRGKRVVFSCYLKADTGTSAAINIEVNSVNVATQMITGLTSTWTRYWVSYVLPVTATGWRFMIYPKNYPISTVQNVLLDGVQVEIVHPEILEYPTDFFDGGSTNCAWSGTANASTSVRTTGIARQYTI